MKTFLLIMTLLSLCSASSYAQKKQSLPKSATTSPDFLATASLFTPAISFGKYVTPEGLLQLEVGGSMHKEGNVTQRFNASVNYKHYFSGFIMESDFFLKGGIDYMQISYSFDDEASPQRSGFGFKGNNLSALAGLGHEWRKRAWVLGIDWVTVRAPLNWEITEEHMLNGSLYEKQNRDNEENVYLKSAKFEYFRVYLGYNF